MRYRRLTAGICVSLATNYGWDLANSTFSEKAAFAMQSEAVKPDSIRPKANGLMLIVNANPPMRIQRENNPDRPIADLQDTEVIKESHKANLPINLPIDRFEVKPIGSTNTLLLSPSNQVAQAIPIDSNLPNLKPINPPNSISTSAVIERISFSNTGQLLIESSQPVNYRANFDRISGSFNLTVSNVKISANFQRPILTANSPIERIRLSQVGNSVEIGIKTVKGWQVRETQRLNNQQIKLQISSTGVAKIPSNNATQPDLPNNSPSIFSPQNIGDRRRGVIYIDAGHGGRDPGAVANGIQEKDVVLPISLNLGQVLQSMGYTVYYTRTNDVEIDLEPRVAAAERINADVFVSVHANALAANNSDISGIETYHSRNSTVGRELASYVHSQIISLTGARDRSVRGAGFYVIAKTSMPAILVETGFVTNPTEARNLDTPSYQKLMAEAIAKGIDQFMKVRGR